tara:strand:- start:12867 stop:13496 length:630 start_codon:yes stop_codon:yes gene_type:complete
MAASIIGELTQRILPQCGIRDEKAPSWRKMQMDAQQSHRFILKVNGIHPIYISQVSRPGYTVETENYRLLNWHFKYPTNIKWGEMTFTVREVFSDSVARIFINKLRACGYSYPSEEEVDLTSKDLSKAGLVNSLGNISIQNLRPDMSVHEEWFLKNAFITGVKFSEMNYSNADLTSVQITLSYDWAELEVYDSPEDREAKVTAREERFI